MKTERIQSSPISEQFFQFLYSDFHFLFHKKQTFMKDAIQQ